MCINFQLKPVRSLDSLRSAWSGRLRHGPLPSTTSTSTEIYDSSRTSDSFSSALESSSTNSSTQFASQKLGESGTPLISTTFDTLLDISDSSNTNSSSNINGLETSSPSSIRSLMSLTKSDNIPFASLGGDDRGSENFLNDNQGEKSSRTSHEFINPTNPFVNHNITRDQPLLKNNHPQSQTEEHFNDEDCPEPDFQSSFKENNSSVSFSWNNNLLDANLNVTNPSSQLIVDDPFDTSQILNPFHPQNPLFHPISPKPSPTSIQPPPPLNIQHYSAQAKVNTITSLFN